MNDSNSNEIYDQLRSLVCKHWFNVPTETDEDVKNFKVFLSAIEDANYKVVYEYASKVKPMFEQVLNTLQTEVDLINQIIEQNPPKPILKMHRCVVHSYKNPSSCLCRMCKHLCAVDEDNFVCNVCDQAVNALTAIEPYTTEEIVEAFKVDPDGFCKMFVDRGTEEVPMLEDMLVDEPESETTQDDNSNGN